MKISEYMNCLPTEKEKQEKWMRIVGKMMAQAENYFHSRKQNYKELITTLQNEFDGGNCPKENCRKAWIRIEFDNLFLAGIYFIPNCDCYIKCPVCKKWLYELQLNGYMQPNENGELKCPECKFYLKILDNGILKSRHGAGYEKYYDKLNRHDKHYKSYIVGHKIGGK